jgi:hypothetical protein
VLTAAHLYERLGRYDRAEKLYAQVKADYQDPADLLGFYYRAVVGRNDATYARAWQKEREQVFPDDLVRTAVSHTPPAHGLFVEGDSPAAREAGIQRGDIIVAVDGWHVDNMPQYYAVRAFPLDGRFTLTIWRANRLREVTIADKHFVPEFRIANYPLEGWNER